MRASEFILNEIFNSDISGKIIRATNTSFITTAKIGNRDIKFFAQGDYGSWDIIFSEQMANGGPTFSKTGSGNELQVFSFVIESLKLVISKYSPEIISFTSDKSDGNRTSVYSKLSRRIKIPGYHVQILSGSGDSDIFQIIRDDK